MENKIVREVGENIGQLIKEKQAVIAAAPLPALAANRAQLTQLFQNLICNAIGHNAAGITVSISARRQGDAWLFCVADNGAGIEERYLDQIFQPFKRVACNEDGAGLGLSTCRKIVESCNGKIWCESRPRQGAAFFFTLPDARVEPPAAESPALAAPSSPAGEENPLLASILLVDDRESDLDLTRIILTNKLGIECNLYSARSGREAIEILRRKRRENSPVNLMLLDINMPEMDGFEVLQSIRNDTSLKDMAVVMCSGSTYDKDRQRAISLGAVGYVVKPIRLGDFKEAVSRLGAIELCPTADGLSLRRSA